MSRLSSAFGAALALGRSSFTGSPAPARAHVGRVRLTKHGRRFGKGRVHLSDYSSLRKLMRAARRGKLAAERLGSIEHAAASIAKRIPQGYTIPR